MLNSIESGFIFSALRESRYLFKRLLTSIVMTFLVIATPIMALAQEGGVTVVQMIKRNASAFAIDGNHGSADQQDVYLWAENENNINQQWYEIDRGNGYFSYKKVGTNHCLDGGRGGAIRQNVYLWRCIPGTQNQHWLKVDVGDGHYRLEKRNAPGFSIDGNNGGKRRQSVYLWASDDGNRNQHWYFNIVGDENVGGADVEIPNVEIPNVDVEAPDGNIGNTDAFEEEFVFKSQASRFLAQASMGGTVEEINALAERISEIGYLPACEEWIDNQMSLPRDPSLVSQTNAMVSADRRSTSANAVGDYWHLSWWNAAIRSDEQLRHRMAFALSQIAVVSTDYWNGLFRANRYLGHVRYYDMLMDNAFASHRDFLQDVTYSKMMGVWLSHAQNAKADPELDTIPDENYAREVMQLFSIGVFARDAYGNILTDAQGEPIENYNDDDIAEFAQVFTGLSIGGNRPFFGKNLTLIGTGPLVMRNQYHDTSEKHLLNGVVLPAGQNGNTDISQALDLLSDHSSTAPYFSRLLIQRFTSSNPSSDYIKRVTDSWYGSGPYGSGQVGDFKAVLKAILLDSEARNSVTYERFGSLYQAKVADPTRGKIKEPILKLTQLYRFAGLEQDTVDGNLRIERGRRSFGQNILGADTVFNFYDAGFAPSTGPIGDFSAEFEASTGEALELTAPEAQILSPNVIGEFARMHSLIRDDVSSQGTNASEIPKSKVLSDISESPFESDAELIRYFDVMLCHGQLPLSVTSQLRNSINAQGGASPEALTDLLSVIFASPAYSVAN